MLTEFNRPGAALIHCANRSIACENGVFPAGEQLPANSLAAKIMISDTPRWFAFDPNATDGREIPAAYVPNPVRLRADLQRALLFARLCEIEGDSIAWPENITPEQQANAIQALARIDIIVR